MQHDFILLDRSGSMADADKWVESLKGINAYVKKLADDKVDTGVTLATFDKPHGDLAFEVIRDRITPSTWRPVSDADAKPRGWTPLSDGVGRIVALAEAGHNGKQYDRVAIIIATDGMENASKELTVEQAKAALDRCRAKGWVVIFLGANFDNVQQGAGYGSILRQTVNSSVKNLTGTFVAAGAKRATYGVTGQAATMDWSSAEQAAAKEE